jgi:hypothetical protein
MPSPVYNEVTKFWHVSWVGVNKLAIANQKPIWHYTALKDKKSPTKRAWTFGWGYAG